MTKPRVLLIHHSGLFGGGGLSLIDLWQTLERDYEVTAYVPEHPADLREVLSNRGYVAKTFDGRLGKIPYYSGGDSLLHPRFYYYIMLAFLQRGRWRKIIESERPDVVVVNSGVLSWMSRVTAGVPAICFVRETMQGNPGSVLNRYIRRLRDGFDGVCYLSEYDRSREQLRSAGQLVVPDAVDPRFFSATVDRHTACGQLGISDQPVNILYLGGSSFLKGYDQVLRAAEYLDGANVQILLAGYLGPLRHQSTSFLGSSRTAAHRGLVELADELENKGLTRRIGVVHDVRLAYSACDAVIFPMREPHQARPHFEAGFQGKPIVISDFPNIRACVHDGVNGLLFRPGDECDLARAILRLANNPVERCRMGNENRRHAEAFHSQEAAFQDLEQFVSQLVNGRRR